MGPVIKELEKYDIVESVICLTGQHREMLQQVLEAFHITPDYNLDIMKEKQDLFSITIDILERLKSVLEKECPDIILVHGDTTTSFVAGLAGFYMKIPVGHVEAGLRTYNVCSPYPEEFNRQAIDIFSDFYFAPTQEAKRNLIQEGKIEKNIYVTGNTVIDALKNTIDEKYIDENLEWSRNSKMILLTMHRRENLGMPMRNVFKACRRILKENREVKIIFPVHKNPAIRRMVLEEFGKTENIRLIEPLDVVAFHNYMNKAYFVMTDSGGVQEEAPSLEKPVLVLRDTTERPEGVKAGVLKVIGTQEDRVYMEAKRLLEDKGEYERMSKANNPYGDGNAAKRIVDVLLEWYGGNK